MANWNIFTLNRIPYYDLLIGFVLCEFENIFDERIASRDYVSKSAANTLS